LTIHFLAAETANKVVKIVRDFIFDIIFFKIII